MTSRLEVSRDLRRFFTSYELTTTYDADVPDNRSVLVIPALAMVMPLAWVTGSDVEVGALDATFADSLAALQDEYRRVYPTAPFSTRLRVGRRVLNETPSDHSALLFSGGLDSMYSLSGIVERAPRLLLVLGTDMPNHVPEYSDQVTARYRAFAGREGLEFNVIRTNALDLRDCWAIHSVYRRHRGGNEGDLWNGVGYSLGHIGLTAPLSLGRFGRLIFAASFDEANAEPIANQDASSPRTDQLIAWADLNVEHHGCRHRHQKVAEMREPLRAGRFQLRVCGHFSEIARQGNPLNCSRCEKCLRTITALVCEQIDPNTCGFVVDESTFALARATLETRQLTRKKLTLFWKPLQERAADQRHHDIAGSRRFLEWFGAVDLDTVARPPRSLPWLRDRYFTLPPPVMRPIEMTRDVLRKGWWTLRRLEKSLRGPSG